jgi:hypothetical protein
MSKITQKSFFVLKFIYYIIFHLKWFLAGLLGNQYRAILLYYPSSLTTAYSEQEAG